MVALVCGLVAFFNSRAQRPLTLGLVTWIGYAPFYIADEKGFFKDEGLHLETKVMDQPGEREAAYLAGRLDFFPNTPDAFAILFANQNPPGTFIAALDESSGADGLITKKEITTIPQLKGKTIGFQKGITSHFLLLYLLKEKGGLTGADVRQESLSAGDAGAAFMAGKLDAAVTWEPWLTRAQQSPDSHVLATTKDAPGLVVDVVLASDRVIKEKPEVAQKFMKAWYRALEYLNKHPAECQIILAKHMTVAESEVAEMLKTTNFLTENQSKDYLLKRFQGIANMASTFYMEEKVISNMPDFGSRINPVSPTP